MVFSVQGNVGLIFTKGDLKEVSEEVEKYKVLLCFLSSGSFLIRSSVAEERTLRAGEGVVTHSCDLLSGRSACSCGTGCAH